MKMHAYVQGFLRFGLREHQEILWGRYFQQNVQTNS